MMFNTEMIVKDMKGGKEDMTETIVTEYGNATLNRDGYFKINTGKNAGKLLHRVIFEDFYNIISTIVRERETAKIILLSNTIDRTHWIFDEFPTREIIDTISEGQVVKFVTDEGMKFYIEFCYHAETRERKKFVNSHIFGFKNPKLTAIKGGGWNMKLYPHIQRGEEKETLLTNIAIETTSGYLSLDVSICFYLSRRYRRARN